MSDPVTNIDIEDVLSSIRRLVAEGSGTMSVPVAPAAAAPTPAAGQAWEGRLILTPALRVHDGTRDRAGPEAQVVKPAPTIAVEAPTIAAEAPAVAAPDSDFAPETDPVAEPLEEAGRVDPPAEASAADRSRLEATIAELEAAVGEQSGEWDPDGSEPDPVFGWSSAEVVEGTLFSHRAPGETVGRDTAADLDDLTADAAESGPTGSEEAPLIDEEMLRALVAEIVRQELQGALGERITRNVRKLVRREIYRVLSSQEFD